MREPQLDRLEQRLAEFESSVLRNFDAVRNDIADARAEISSVRLLVREQFENIHDRLAILAGDTRVVRSELVELRKQVAKLADEFAVLNGAWKDTNLRIVDLREDMQQQFRVVNERLSALEQRLAA